MMPRGRFVICSGLISGTTSGTSGSMRNAPELSTATTPRLAALGAQTAETSSGTSNIATSAPSNTSSLSTETRTSTPRTRSVLPAERFEAASRISPQTSTRVDNRSSITVPTAPVAPTTTSTGPADDPPPAGPAVHNRLDLVSVQVEGTVRGGHRRVDIVLVHDDRDPDLRRRDHFDVDPSLGKRAEEGGADTRVRAHARTDERHLSYPVVVEQRLKADLARQALQLCHRGLSVSARQRERDVGPGGGRGGNVLHDHVDVDLGFSEGTEDARGLAHLVRHADDSDLRFAPVMRDAGDDRLLHFLFSRCCFLPTGREGTHHPGARTLAERRPDMDRNAVPAGVLDTSQVQNLCPARRHLQHLLVADARHPPRARHDAGIGGEHPVHIGVDLTHVGTERRG